MVLHTIAIAPGNSAFGDCLRYAARGDTILLLGDAVYAAIGLASACDALRGSEARIVVLDSDCRAAGIDPHALAFPTIDMDGFVALSEYYPRQLAWY